MLKFLYGSTCLWLATVLVAQTTVLMAQTTTLQQAGERLRVKQGLQVAFEQRVLTIRKKIRLTTGEGFFHPDGSFRWVITHRGQMVRTYVYDRKTITEYLPEEKTANVWSLKSAKTDAISRIVALIKSPHQLKRDYVVKEQQQTNNKLQLLLVPRESNDIRDVAVTLDLKANFISKVKITYRHKRYNEFVFSNPQRKKITAAQFKFTPPAGTKVNYLQ